MGGEVTVPAQLFFLAFSTAVGSSASGHTDPKRFPPRKCSLGLSRRLGQGEADFWRVFPEVPLWATVVGVVYSPEAAIH